MGGEVKFGEGEECVGWGGEVVDEDWGGEGEDEVGVWDDGWYWEGVGGVEERVWGEGGGGGEGEEGRRKEEGGEDV